MIIVNIRFKSVEVVKFDLKEGIEFKICFDDGVERCINKTSSIQDPVTLAEEIFMEIRKAEKRYNQQYGGEVMDDVIIVRFENEEATLQKLAGFFLRVKDKVANVKSSKEAKDYLNKISEIKRLRTDF